MLVSEAIEKIRRRINDEFDTGYSDEVLINYINDAKEYLSHALIARFSPELTEYITVDSTITNFVPTNFVKFCGGFPVRRKGNLFFITDTTLPIVEVKYFFIPNDVLAVTDNMPFQNNDTYNMLIINLASIYALNQHEFDVNQDSALKQAIEGMIDNALGGDRMRLSAKHEQKTVTYGNFTGGLNNTSVPEQIAENQLAECVNMEFNRATGALETCCGTAMVFKAPDEVSVDWITYDGINNKFIFADLRTRKLYKTSLVDMTGTVANDCEFLGTLTGNLKPKSVQWEDGTLIASGGKLQYWNGKELKTLGVSFTDYASKWDYIGRIIWYWHVQTNYVVGDVVKYNTKIYYCTTAHFSTYSFDPTKWAECNEVALDYEKEFNQYDVVKYKDEYYVCNTAHRTGKGAPENCNGVFVKNGRVWVWYDYTLQCSAVGDEEDWRYDTTDDSSSKYIDVGYKDGENEHGFIVGVTALSSALVILKNNGVVYKLTGDYPDWSLNEIARGIKPLNPESYIGTPNGVLIVGKSGMYMLETTDEYGDIKPANLASNIIGMFCLLTMDNTVVRFLPNLNQVWITGLNNSVIVYSLDFKVFFERQFNNMVSDVTTNTTEVFIARKDKVTRLTRGIYEDEKYSDDEAPMSWSFQAKSLLSFYDILVKRFRVSYVPLMDEFDRAEILIGDEKLVLGMPDRISDSPLIFTNTTLIYNDLGFIFETMTQFNTTWAVYRKRVVDVKGKGYGSAISLNSIEIAVAEV